MNAMNVLKQIICVWLVFWLHGILLVGLVKVEVQTKPVSDKVEQKQQNNFKRTTITQTGLWTGIISERIYIRNNVIQIDYSKQMFPHPTALINTISITRGTVYVFP